MNVPINVDDIMEISQIMHEAQQKISILNPTLKLELSVKNVLSSNINDEVNIIYSKLRLPRDDNSRKLEYLIPRHIIVLYLVKHKGYSLKSVGKVFGNKHHTTMINCINEARKYLETNQFNALDILKKIKEAFK